MDDLVTALNATGFSFTKYAWDHAPSGDYGVISLQYSNDFISGNSHVEKGNVYAVDYFTRDPSSTPQSTIEAALDAFPYSLESVQYEDDTGYIHYAWSVGIYGT